MQKKLGGDDAPDIAAETVQRQVGQSAADGEQRRRAGGVGEKVDGL
jgi:hypothetical protein